MPAKYVAHPACLVWPRTDTDIENMAHSIERRGQLVPIDLLADRLTVIDGWTRYLACVKLSRKPQFRVLPKDTDPIAHVISVNARRRHMEGHALTKLVSDLAKLEKGGDRRSDQFERDQIETIEDISKRLGGPPAATVSRFRAVEKADPELAQKVVSKEVSLAAATRTIKQPEPTGDARIDEGSGKPMKPHIVELFAASDQIGEWVRALRIIVRDINKAVRGNEPWTAYIQREPIVAGISNSASQLSLAELYCECPCCAGDGKGCDHCHGRFDPDEKPGSIGAVNKMTYDIVPDGLKRGKKK